MASTNKQLNVKDRSHLNTLAASRPIGQDLYEVIDNGQQRTQVTLTAAQVLALNATPVTVVAAPGAGKTLVVEGMLMELNYNSTQYTVGAGEKIDLQYVGGSVVTGSANEAWLGAGSNNDNWVYGHSSANSGKVALENTAIEAFMQTGEVADGDSTVTLTIFYRVVDTNI